MHSSAWLWLLLTVVALGGSVSCDRSPNGPTESVSVRSSRLIDEQRTEEAIQLLEPHVRANPEDIDAAVSLSAAYAHKAGFQFRSFYGMLNQILEHSKRIKTEPTPATAGSASTAERAIATWTYHSGRMFGLIRIFEAIPSLTKSNIEFVRHGVQILSSKEQLLRPKDRAFRVLLRAVIIKHLLTQIAEPHAPVASPKKEGQNPSQKICFVDFRAVDKYINTPGGELISLFADMAWIQPKGKEAFARTVSEIRNSVSNINVFLTAVSLVNDATLLYLKNSVVDGSSLTASPLLPNLGQLIACEE